MDANQHQSGKTGKNGTGATQTRYTRWAYDAIGRHANRTYEWSGSTGLPLPPGGQQAGELLVGDVLARNILGQPEEVKGLYGITTTNKYGVFGRLQHSYSDIGTWTTTTYHETKENCPSTGTLVRVRTVTAEGQVTDDCLDALGRSIRTTRLGFKSGEVVFQEAEYTYLGTVKRESLPHFSTVTGGSIKWKTYTYDDLGRVTSVTEPDGSETSYSYDGLKTIVENALDQLKTEVRNVLGEVLLVIEPLTVFVRHEYDSAGNLTKSTSGDNYPSTPTKSSQVVMTYDTLGRRTSLSDPDMGHWSYAYNAFGELVEQTDAKLQKTIMTYDPLGRMRTRKEYWPNSVLAHDSSWTYDTATSYGTQPGHLITSFVGHFNNLGTSTGQEFKVFSYDHFGRSTGYAVDLDNGALSAAETVTYDQHGRTFQHFDMTDDHWGIQYVYNARGYLSQLLDSRYENESQRTVYLTVQEMDAFGNVSKELLGNGATVTHAHNPATGRLEHIGGSIGAIFNRQDLTMSYDALGNLKSRRDQRESFDLQESFCYDTLNRLVKQQAGTLTGSCAGINHSNGDIRYDALGNITYKQGVGSYTYSSSRPHAVTQAGNSVYDYDANGNMLTGKSATFSYGIFNKPLSITRNGGNSSAFAYGIERDRYKRTDQTGSDTTITWYVGSAELIERPAGTREIKRSIAGRVLVTHSLNSAGEVTATDTAYLLKDHLGSVVAVLNGNGANVQALAFNPWGQRRDSTNWPSLLAQYQPGWDTSHTTRGFTSHEHLDALGLIHMNGRVYDPYLGRFTSADPFIQFPHNSQSYNRYSYVLNNPLSYTDPSGHFVFTLGAIAVAAVKTLSVYEAAALFAAAGFSDTLVAGGSFDQALKNGIISGVSAGAFTKLGTATNFSSFEAGIVRVGSFGAVGGITSMLAGGKFGHGFVSAGVGVASQAIPGAGQGVAGSHIKRTVVAAIVGGTSSGISGGKFANGAATATFASIVSQAAYKYSDVGRGGSGEDWWSGYEMPDDMEARYNYALAMDWTGAISVLGGTAQLGTGILACSSLVGCAGGAYLGAHGLNNIYEGFTGEAGLLREGYKAIFGEDWGDIAYGAADVGTSVHGATKLVLKPDAWKLFRHIPSDYVRAYSITSTPALMGQGAVDTVTIYDTYQRVTSK